MGEEQVPHYKKRFKGFCRNCGKQGHKSFECRSSSKPKAGGTGPKKDMSKVKCFKCQKMGHYANKCFGGGPEPKPGNKQGPTEVMFSFCTETLEPARNQTDLSDSFELIDKADEEFMKAYSMNNHLSTHSPVENDGRLTDDFFDN